MSNNTFGQQLRRARRKAFLTQHALANRVNISNTYISKIELGTLPLPGEALIQRIAEILGDEALIYAAGHIPHNLRTLAKDNAALAELLTTLSRETLPNSAYRHMIMIAKQHQKEEATR